MTMKNHKHYLLLGGLIFLCASITACVGSPLPMADSLSSTKSSETIVVGKIELSPPFEEDEQSLKTVSSLGPCVFLINPSARQYRNTVILVADDHMRELGEPCMSDYGGRIEAPIGRTFYVRAPNEPMYVIGTEIIMGVDAAGVEKACLPAGYKIDIRPSDRAVYIGTIKYYRDEFFEVTKIELIDDYKKENAAFKRKFGNTIKLRKALIAAEQRIY